ncbi:uncharacterized protein LOC142324633 isoform X2 [Lycorma delicatula]|uniref:uncharacterized protein LOC142324633 isoform X2 n=1 Tax=Lycorma delicatula TaxID=130591 RepID=UPI003F5170DC
MQLHTKIWRKTCCTEDRKVTCTITNPSRSLTENHITSLADGTYRIGCYTPFEEGTVRSVKKETEELFLLTPLNEDMLSQVNSIIKGCVYLPNTIFCNPPESVTGHVPHTSVSNNVLSGVVKKLIIKP